MVAMIDRLLATFAGYNASQIRAAETDAAFKALGRAAYGEPNWSNGDRIPPVTFEAWAGDILYPAIYQHDSMRLKWGHENYGFALHADALPPEFRTIAHVNKGRAFFRTKLRITVEADDMEALVRKLAQMDASNRPRDRLFRECDCMITASAVFKEYDRHYSGKWSGWFLTPEKIKVKL